MANSDTAFGLRPIMMADGSPYVAAVRAYAVPASDGTALMLGDPVKLAGGNQVIDGVTYGTVARAATGDVIAGVVVGVKPVTQSSTIYREASVQRIVQIETGPNVIFEIQEVSGGTALTADAIGLNCDFVVAAGSTTTGMSGVELNNSGEATTNTLDLKIIGLVNRADNEVGEHAKWLVQINRSQWSNQVAGI